MNSHFKTASLSLGAIFCGLGIALSVRKNSDSIEETSPKKPVVLNEAQRHESPKAAIAQTVPQSISSNPEASVQPMLVVSSTGWRGEQIKWLSEADAAKIDFGAIQSLSKVIAGTKDGGTPIKSREEAAGHLNIHVSMAMRPSIGFENNEYFFFSGGNTAYPLNDFTKGLGVRKVDGGIISW